MFAAAVIRARAKRELLPRIKQILEQLKQRLGISYKFIMQGNMVLVEVTGPAEAMEEVKRYLQGLVEEFL